MTKHETMSSTDACRSCAAHSQRRDFLRELMASAATALLAVGATPAAARAFVVAFGEAGERRGNQVAYPVPTADGATIDRTNEVIVVRFQNVGYAFALSCPHQNTSLKWLASDGVFQCPKHKSRYRPDGSFIEGRATRGMDRYAVTRDGDKLLVDLDAVFEQDKQAAQWSSAQVSLA
jgi:Rieske Fe-S protein